jgi:hypothetical protein
MFACGYGAEFGTLGSEVYERYRLIDAVYTLFNYDQRLWSPETALFRITREGVALEDLLRKIDRVLILEPGSTTLDSSGLSVVVPASGKAPDGPRGYPYDPQYLWGTFSPIGMTISWRLSIADVPLSLGENVCCLLAALGNVSSFGRK